MRTDRELLELAAKAAGMHEPSWVWVKDKGCLCHYNTKMLCWYRDSYGDRIEWNPLADDGDALRLAVKCEITWVFDNGQCRVYGTKILESFGVDKNAATRRAIVRAAAEIGAALK